MKLLKGVWPTMITPFKKSGEVDYVAVEQLVEWYIKNNVSGIFAVCQSSEMFNLSLRERYELAKFICEKARGRVPIVASGHISTDINDQIAEIKEVSTLDIEAVVLVTNRLARIEESEEVVKANIREILKAFPEQKFGLYECPYPYKRLMSPELLKWCADTGQFVFLKDTSCDAMEIKEKVEAVKGTDLSVMNANSATLLQSLKLGAIGFCGIMGNFHPELYRYLFDNYEKEPEKCEMLQNFLTLASLSGLGTYPENAKYYLSLEGLPIEPYCRAYDDNRFTDLMRDELQQMQKLTIFVKQELKI